MKNLTASHVSSSFLKPTNSRVSLWLVLVLALLLTNGCSGGGSGVDSGGTTQPTVTNSLAASVPIANVSSVALIAGNPTTSPIYINLPGTFEWGQVTEASFDATATLSSLTIVRTDGGNTPDPTLELSLKVAAGDDAGACASGTQALRTEMTGAADFSGLSVSADETTMPQTAIDIINSGSFTMCTSATSSVDANLTLTGFGISFGFAENCAAPQDLAGVWIGNYTCNDSCQGTTSTDAGPIEITVTQSGGTATYRDDSGASYVGSVCASNFRHLGLGGGYFEYGALTRTGPTTATKTSTWVSTRLNPCGGFCTDTLTLSPN